MNSPLDSDSLLRATSPMNRWMYSVSVPWVSPGFRCSFRACMLLSGLLSAVSFGCSSPGQEPKDAMETAGDTGDLYQPDIRSDSSADSPDKPEPPPYCEVDDGRTQLLMESLETRQAIGQHFVSAIERSGEDLSPESETKLRQGHLGNVFVAQLTGVAENDPLRTARFLASAQQVAMEETGIPLFVATDQEGGVYTSVNATTGGTDSIGPAAIGATRNPEVAHAQYDLMGRELRALGISMNFGPLLDTQYYRANGNLNTRTFGPDMQLNTLLGPQAIMGMQKNLVLTVTKHFPGDGLTSGNPHHDAVVNHASLARLEAEVLPPFRAAFDAGADGTMIMPARFDSLDDQRPAITSRPVITDYLRGKVGFDGLVVTDDMNMAGASIGLEPGQSKAVEALKAGADIVLFVGLSQAELDQMIGEVEAALDSGYLDREEFDRSTKRIIDMKQRYCLFDLPQSPADVNETAIGESVGRVADHETSLSHAIQAVTVVKNEAVLPLPKTRVACVGPSILLADAASGWSWMLGASLCNKLKTEFPTMITLDYVVEGGEASARTWLETHTGDFDVLVFATFNAWFSYSQKDLTSWVINNINKPIVHIAQGVALDVMLTSNKAAGVVALQGSLPIMFEAAARVLSGQSEAGGTVLFDVTPGSWDYGKPVCEETTLMVDLNGALTPSIDCEGQGWTCKGGTCKSSGGETKTEKQWREKLVDMSLRNTVAPLVLDQYGGWKNPPSTLGRPTVGTKEFFSVQKIKDRWWFVTPEGNLFVSKGVTDVNIAGAKFYEDDEYVSLEDKYGSEEDWRQASLKRMSDWNYNTAGPWTSVSIMQSVTHAGIILDSAGHAPHYPGFVVTDLWSQGFIDHCSKVAVERATPWVEDKRLLGYFLDNEVTWEPNWKTELTLLQNYMDFPADAPGRAVAVQFLKDSAATAQEFNGVWGTEVTSLDEISNLKSSDLDPKTDQAVKVTREFAVKAFHQYATVAVAALKAVDPNHLILGCRFHTYHWDELVIAAAQHFDVISLAYYESMPPTSDTDRVSTIIDKPFLLEEFSFKAEDSGLMNILYYAPVVKTQKDRGLGFESYVFDWMRRPYAVAYHWYKWFDNPKESTNILAGDNFGLMASDDEPYVPFVDFAKEVNHMVEFWHADGLNSW